MTTVYDVPADRLIKKAAAKLKEVPQLAPPEWAPFARTGVHTSKPPEQPDWWFTRAAAVLRKVYLLGPIGVERLSAEFGGKRDRGSSPYHAFKGSRNVTRTALQKLTEAGLVTSADKKGRRVSPKGQELLDDLAHEVKGELVALIPGLAKY